MSGNKQPNNYNKLYTAFSGFNYISSVFVRFFIASGMVYCAMHYNENPPVIIIALIMGLLMLLLIGSEELAVFPDRIEIRSNNLWEWLFGVRPSTYTFTNLEEACVQKKGSLTETVIAVAFRMLVNQRPGDKIELYLHYNNNTQTIVTYLRRQKIEKVAAIINQCIGTKQ